MQIRYLLYICLFPFVLFAQKDFNLKSTYSVNIVTKDTTVKAEALYGPRNIPAKKELLYYWYTNNKIIATQGAYQGRLLHGEYRVLYNSTNNLKEKGYFENGTKTGEWISWYSNGLIKESLFWKKGKLNGAFKKYDSKGKLVREGKYSNNLLDGNLFEYSDGKLVTAVKYKKGILVETAKPTMAKEEVESEKQIPKQKNTATTSKKDTTTKQNPSYKKSSNVTPDKKKPTITTPK